MHIIQTLDALAVEDDLAVELCLGAATGNCFSIETKEAAWGVAGGVRSLLIININ